MPGGRLLLTVSPVSPSFEMSLLLFPDRLQIQEKCIQRPSVGQSKSLLKAKILGSIGGGPFELLRAFRKMHCGRGTVRRRRGEAEAANREDSETHTQNNFGVRSSPNPIYASLLLTS